MNGKSTIAIFSVSLLLIALAGCSDDEDTTTNPQQSMSIGSTAFSAGAAVPTLYTCDGEDISLPLQWEEVPDGTESLALIVDDPDAPGGTWIHWVLFNIPGTTMSLGQGVSPAGSLPVGSLEGINSFGNQEYGGPCPPAGSNHRYYFRLYALDTTLILSAGSTRAQLDQAMSGHILDHCELMGTYGR